MTGCNLQEWFYYFLRLGLGCGGLRPEGLGDTFPAELWSRLFDMAKKQAVSGVFVEGVSRSGMKPEKQVWLQWLGHLMWLQRMNRVMDVKGREWLGMLEEAGMEAEVFKGVSVGKWYDNPLDRSYGDIDFVITRGWEKVEDFLKLRGLNCRKEHDDWVCEEEGISLELHRWREYLFSPFTDRKLKRLLREGHGNELYFVCLILHFRRHFLTYGCGLKQVCDIVMMLKNAELDMPEVKHLLRTLNADRFGRVLFGFIQSRFGDMDFPCPPVHGRAERLLEEIVHHDGYLLKMERESSAIGLSSWKRIGSNAAFWVRRCISLFRIMPDEAFWFPLFMAGRRVNELCLK